MNFESRQWFLWFLCLTLCWGCGAKAPTAPDLAAQLDALLAPPTSAEVAAAISELVGRSASGSSSGLEMLDTRQGAYADLSLVSYLSEGRKIYGVISLPRGSGTYPIVLYNHGGDQGLSTLEIDQPLAGAFVFAASSFRDEAVNWFGVDYRSEGPPSPWDRDVDDALALLDAVVRLPQADPTRVVVLGGSRGGGVSLLAAVRQPNRFRCAISVFGPTDFFDPAFRPAVETMASGGSDPRPGMVFLNAHVVHPYVSGVLSLQAARSELIRRSALYFADRLPPLQIHHGTADETVPVSQSDRLAVQLESRGKPFEYVRNSGAGHVWPLGTESLVRLLSFLERYL